MSNGELDLDPFFADAGRGRLEVADGSIQSASAPRAFTRIAEDWADRLLEVFRVLGDGGRLAVGLSDPRDFVLLCGREWDESRIGMTVLSDETGDPLVFHSEWWLRAHWGRGFEIVLTDDEDGPRRAIIRKSGSRLSREELERVDPAEPRELIAARANVSYLRAQLSEIERRHRRELDDVREEMGRELMRRSFAAADAEWSRGGAGSPAALVAANYEATTSWRVTRPLRALGRVLRREA